MTFCRPGIELQRNTSPPDPGSITRRYRPIPSSNRQGPLRLVKYSTSRVQDRSEMKNAIKTLAVVATGALLATSAFAQSAASLVVPVENEPAARLFVESPLPGPLAGGVAFIPYRSENLRILPVGGPAARNVSPRVGHLHITLDDLPWQWA